MGGSAGGGNNAQIFELMSQYGGDEGGGGVGQKQGPSRKELFQKSFADYIKSHPNGSTGIFAGFGDGGFGGGGRGNGGGGNTTPPPAQPPGGAEKFAWQFPQYTQTWAFTPPAPTPYEYPQPFDPKKYGNPLTSKNVKKNV